LNRPRFIHNDMSINCACRNTIVSSHKLFTPGLLQFHVLRCDWYSASVTTVDPECRRPTGHRNTLTRLHHSCAYSLAATYDNSSTLTLWPPLLPYGHSYKACYARPGKAVICNFLTSGHTDAQPSASVCPNVKNYNWRLNPVWYRMFYSCAHMATIRNIVTVGVKGLSEVCYRLSLSGHGTDTFPGRVRLRSSNNSKSQTRFWSSVSLFHGYETVYK